MPVALNVKSNIRPFKRKLSRIKRKQLPFATSKALNDTIFDVRRHIVGPVWSRAFEAKNARFASATFRVAKSTKRKLVASLFDALNRANLALHETGGVKRPFRGQHLAVPVGVKRTASGKISKGRRPAALRGKGGVFKTRLSTGNEGLVERRGKKGKLSVLYTLPRAARIKAKFPFEREAHAMAARRFTRRFKVSLERALRTAR